jgi:hypothetical protein
MAWSRRREHSSEGLSWEGVFEVCIHGKVHHYATCSDLLMLIIQGKVGEQEYAIFQCKQYNSSETENAADLKHELNLLTLMDYFLQSFLRRARMNNCKLPSRINYLLLPLRY